MGQHKYNVNCQLAMEGKLPPKPKKMSKRQQERLLMKLIYQKTGLGAIDRELGTDFLKEAEDMLDISRYYR